MIPYLLLFQVLHICLFVFCPSTNLHVFVRICTHSILVHICTYFIILFQFRHTVQAVNTYVYVLVTSKQNKNVFFPRIYLHNTEICTGWAGNPPVKRARGLYFVYVACTYMYDVQSYVQIHAMQYVKNADSV